MIKIIIQHGDANQKSRFKKMFSLRLRDENITQDDCLVPHTWQSCNPTISETPAICWIVKEKRAIRKSLGDVKITGNPIETIPTLGDI